MSSSGTGGPFRLLRLSGDEGGKPLVPLSAAARLHVQVQGRTPAAGDAEQIAIELNHAAALRFADRYDVDAGHLRPAVCRGDGVAEAARDPSRERSLRQRSGTSGARIDDGDDLCAGALQIKRCPVS